MGVHHPGQMGPEHSQVGVLHTVSGPSPPAIGCSENSCSIVPPPKGGPRRRNRIPPQQRSNRVSASLRGGPRLLQHVLPGAKETGRVPADPQPPPLQPFRYPEGIHARQHQISPRLLAPSGLRYFYRSQGCLLPCPHPSFSSQVPQVSLWRAPPTIQGPPFRPVFQPSGLLQMPGTDHCPLPWQGHQTTSLFGRLAPHQQEPSPAARADYGAHYAAGTAGLVNCLYQVPSNSQPELHVHRSPVRHRQQCHGPNDRQDLQSGGYGSTDTPLSLGSSCTYPRGTGAYGVHDRRPANDSFSYEGNPAGPTTPVETEEGSSNEADFHGSRGPNGPQLVGGPQELANRRPYMAQGPSGLNPHGCLHILRVGSPLGGQGHPGHLVTTGGDSSHQHPRDANSPLCLEGLGCGPPGELHRHSLGQHYCSPIHNEARGDSIPAPLPPRQGAVDISPPVRHSPPSSPYSREGEHHSRRLIQGTGLSTFDGVVNLPTGLGMGLQHLGATHDRPFRPQDELQASDILLVQEGQGGMEDGCSVHQLALDLGIRISPIQPDSPGAGARSPVQLSAPAPGTTMGEANLVPNDPQHVVRLPCDRPVSPAPPQIARDGPIPPGPRIPQVNNVADFRLRVQMPGVSDSASRLLMAAWRGGTQRVYSAQYRIFSRWCAERNINSFNPSISNIIDFLASLYDDGRQYKTICVYRSMLSNAIGEIDGHKVGQHPGVIRLLRGVFNSRPPRKTLVPEWDLRLVLRALKKGPFEPMASAHPKCITYKLAFLLAITTARRVSDLSHLAIGSHCRVHVDAITFMPTALAKADDPSHFMEPIVVPAFHHDDRLCVVRTLKYYLALTEDRRDGRAPLTLLRCLVKPFDPASPQTISKWVVRLIQLCYEVSGKEKPSRLRAHSTRAVAPNWAAMDGAPLRRILEAADWRCQSTFARFYLRDMCEERGAFGRAVLSAQDIPGGSDM